MSQLWFVEKARIESQGSVVPTFRKSLEAASVVMATKIFLSRCVVFCLSFPISSVEAGTLANHRLQSHINE